MGRAGRSQPGSVRRTHISRLWRENQSCGSDAAESRSETPRVAGLLARALGGLEDLAGFETAGAEVLAPRRPADVDPDLLKVRVETPLGGDHRMRAAVPERG